jgi:hypothetical protein
MLSHETVNVLGKNDKQHAARLAVGVKPLLWSRTVSGVACAPDAIAPNIWHRKAMIINTTRFESMNHPFVVRR